MTWQFSSIRLRMYSLFQKYRARSATWGRIKRENEGREHKQVRSSPPRVHKYYRQTPDKQRCWMTQCGRNAPVWKRKLTWKWGLEMQAEICLNRGSCTRINWDGSITSRISSISPRNITWVQRDRVIYSTNTLTNISRQTHSLSDKSIWNQKTWVDLKNVFEIWQNVT